MVKKLIYILSFTFVLSFIFPLFLYADYGDVFFELEKQRKDLVQYHSDLESALNIVQKQDLEVATGLFMAVKDSLFVVKNLETLILIAGNLKGLKIVENNKSSIEKIKGLILYGIEDNRAHLKIKLHMSNVEVNFAKQQNLLLIGNNFRATLRKIIDLTEGFKF